MIEKIRCNTCDGRGTIAETAVIFAGQAIKNSKCPVCNGSGFWRLGKSCPSCDDTGVIAIQNGSVLTYLECPDCRHKSVSMPPEKTKEEIEKLKQGPWKDK